VTSAAVAPSVRRWLPFSVPERGIEAGGLRMYCLPHAGGAASAYRSWGGRIGAVTVCPIQLAGRETRMNDVPHDRMAPLVSELADVVLADSGGPYAVYGHSLGALVGYELLQEIRRRGGPDPVHLVVSGCPAPHRSGPGEESRTRRRVDEMTDAEVAGLLRSLGGTPELFLSDPTVLQMILPRVRADFGVKDSYSYQPQAPLNVPITALASTADPRADIESMLAWRDLTVQRFKAYTLTGGHFAALEQAHVTQAYIRRALCGAA
jgi:surfactin synthase thioesterase subunit